MGKARRRKTEERTQPLGRRVETVQAPSTKWTVVYAAAIVGATIAAYAGLRGNGFVYFDDPKYVTENPVVRNGLTLDGIRWAFTTGTDANWFPMTWLSHMLDVQLFGMNAAGHHLTSLATHIASALLLLLALVWMTNAPARSAVVAAFFALHPLHVESVAWVAERKDVLSAFFFMLTMCAYARYARKPSAMRYAAVAIFLAAGLMCKPMLVTLPFVLLLLDWWPLARVGKESIGRLVKEKLPLFGLVIVSSVITFLVQRSGGAVGALDAYPFAARVANAITSYATYIRMMVWPSGLAAFYPYPDLVSQVVIALSLLILATVTYIAAKMFRVRPYIIVGWLWFLGTLVPVIGLVQVGNQAMADRYTYIPLIGLFIIVSWGLAELANKVRLPRPALPIAGGIALAILGVITQRQVAYWKDSTSLWTRALAVTSDNHVAHNNLGRELAESGRIDEAIAEYNAALRIKPAYATARTNLGVALAKRGKSADAVASYNEALRIKPDLPETHSNLGAALAAQGKLAEAIDEYRTAIRLNPNLADAHANLGLALVGSGRVDEGIGEYATALRLKPDFVEVHNNYGYALASQGRLEDAIPHFKEAIRLKPDFVLAHVNLAMTLANAERKPEAIREFKEVLRIDPSHQMAKEAIARLEGR